MGGLFMDDEKLEECLDNLQVECNKLYDGFGASEEVIKLQEAINTLRNKFDLHDCLEEVFEEYVQ